MRAEPVRRRANLLGSGAGDSGSFWLCFVGIGALVNPRAERLPFGDGHSGPIIERHLSFFDRADHDAFGEALDFPASLEGYTGGGRIDEIAGGLFGVARFTALGHDGFDFLERDGFVIAVFDLFVSGKPARADAESEDGGGEDRRRQDPDAPAAFLYRNCGCFRALHDTGL